MVEVIDAGEKALVFTQFCRYGRYILKKASSRNVRAGNLFSAWSRAD